MEKPNFETLIENSGSLNDRLLRLKSKAKTPLFTTLGGEQIYRLENSIVVELPSGRNVITTSWLNGGFRSNIKCIFNHTIPSYVSDETELEGGSVHSYLSLVAERLGFDPCRSAGLLTAAKMENVSIVSKSFRGIQVTAIVTGGIGINGGRAGDPASYYQDNGETKMINGTINTILLIGANLPPYTMARTIITASEAKVVAVQELMAPSCYSCGIATGSGTDMIAVVADSTSPYELTDSGKHSKLGELIGKCVIEATKEALAKQTELTPAVQCDSIVRLKRFGISEDTIWEMACELEGDLLKSDFNKNLLLLRKNPVVVGLTSSILHIIDEVSWGLLCEQNGKKAAFAIISGIPAVLDTKKSLPFNNILKENDSILHNWIRVMSWLSYNVNLDESL